MVKHFLFVISGEWGRNRFEKRIQSESNRNFINIRTAKDFDEKKKLGILSKKMIGPALHHLDRCPLFDLYALCRCVLSEKVSK